MVAARRQKIRSKGLQESPERTCVGCRQRRPVADLLRCVALPSAEDPTVMTVAVDWSGKAPGRGVYLTPDKDCIRKALERGGFQKSLRCRLVLPDVSSFVEGIREGLRRTFFQRLSLARRAGALVSGEARVAASLKEGEGLLLVLATDLSEGAMKKHTLNARRKGMSVAMQMNGEDLGRCIGKPYAGLILVNDEPFAGDLQRFIRQLTDL